MVNWVQNLRLEGKGGCKRDNLVKRSNGLHSIIRPPNLYCSTGLVGKAQVWDREPGKVKRTRNI